MGLSWGDRREIAEREAWRSYGRRHEGAIVGLAVFRTIAPGLAVLAVVGVAGYFAWWGWQHIAAMGGPATSMPTGSVPMWVWLAALGSFIATVVMFRPGRTPDTGFALFAKFAVALALWSFTALVIFGYLS